MKAILNQVWWNNTVESYLYVMGVILVALIIKRLISKYFASQLFKLVAKAGKGINKQTFLDLVIQPVEVFLLLIVAIIAINTLHYPTALQFTIYKVNAQDVIEAVANGTLVLTFIWLLLRIIDFAALVLQERANLTKDQTDNQLIVFFKDFFKVILILIGILLILRFSFHRNIGNLLTGLSLVGAAVALATRESLENLIASFIIFFDKPFTTGDLVKVNNFTGNVEKIGLRSTRIRTDSKTYITVPNKQMVDTILDNISLRSERRVEMKLELALSCTSAQIKRTIAAIKQLLQQYPAIESNTVYFMETGKNAHIISIDYFTTMEQDINAFIQLREDVNFAVIDFIAANNIEIAASETDIAIRQR
jgi:MscS family membrane protein